MGSLAKELTVAQIWAAIASVVAIVSIASNWSNDIFGMKIGPAVKKLFLYFQKRWFREAIFRKDVMDAINEIRAEVKYNGGKVVLSDAVKRLEIGQEEMKQMIAYNQAARAIEEACSDRMKFKMDKEGSCIWINDAFLKFFGWQESDVLEMAFENIVADEDVSDMRLKWNNSISKKISFKDEQRVRDSNGIYHRCSVIAKPVIVGDALIEFHGFIELLD